MMKKLEIYCAGAAKVVVSQAINRYRRETGREVDATYGAVGFLQDKMLNGGCPDIIVTTASLMAELVANGKVHADQYAALGAVGTGVAVRVNTPLPDVSTEQAFRTCLLQASYIICPDPTIATAGKILFEAFDALGVTKGISSKLVLMPSGYTAMERLRKGDVNGEVGIMQVTEIVADEGITFAGPLPPSLQKMTIYSAGVMVGADGAALTLLERFTGSGAQDILRKGGFVLV